MITTSLSKRISCFHDTFRVDTQTAFSEKCTETAFSEVDVQSHSTCEGAEVQPKPIPSWGAETSRPGYYRRPDADRTWSLIRACSSLP
jgi:hypothetical protein